ncbi:MAG TPA: hypothetical protein VK789_00020 [Bryobacteraceae bacterium]|nr:hypothetical protein [Bryobacteraceae bacterium]
MRTLIRFLLPGVPDLRTISARRNVREDTPAGPDLVVIPEGIDAARNSPMHCRR